MKSRPDGRDSRRTSIAARRRETFRRPLRATARAASGSNASVEAARELSAPLGRITISSDAIAQIVGHVAEESYGVVGMAGSRIGRLLARDKLTRGIEIGHDGDAITIELHVVVVYGLKLAEVASTIRNRVAYEVARLTGLRVASVEVHIADVRRS